VRFCFKDLESKQALFERALDAMSTLYNQFYNTALGDQLWLQCPTTPIKYLEGEEGDEDTRCNDMGHFVIADIKDGTEQLLERGITTSFGRNIGTSVERFPDSFIDKLNQLYPAVKPKGRLVPGRIVGMEVVKLSNGSLRGNFFYTLAKGDKALVPARYSSEKPYRACLDGEIEMTQVARLPFELRCYSTVEQPVILDPAFLFDSEVHFNQDPAQEKFLRDRDLGTMGYNDEFFHKAGSLFWYNEWLTHNVRPLIHDGTWVPIEISSRVAAINSIERDSRDDMAAEMMDWVMQLSYMADDWAEQDADENMG
jgi:hypothetical protein